MISVVRDSSAGPPVAAKRSSLLLGSSGLLLNRRGLLLDPSGLLEGGTAHHPVAGRVATAAARGQLSSWSAAARGKLSGWSAAGGESPRPTLNGHHGKARLSAFKRATQQEVEDIQAHRDHGGGEAARGGYRAQREGLQLGRPGRGRLGGGGAGKHLDRSPLRGAAAGGAGLSH